MVNVRDGKEQAHLTLREGKNAKVSTSADERKKLQCTEIGLLSRSAVLLVVSVILSLPEYSIAQAGAPLPLSNDDKTAVMTKINELRADKNALMMDCIRFWNNSMAAYAQMVANNCSSVAPDNEKYPLAISVAKNEAIENAFGSIDEIGYWYNAKSKQCDQDSETEVFSTEQCQNFRQFYRYEAHEVGCAKSRCEKITPDEPGKAQVVNGSILWVCAFTSKAPPQLLPYIDLPVSVSSCEICSYQKSVCGALTNNLCCDLQWDTFVIPPESKPGPSDPDKDVSPPDVHVDIILYKDNALGRTIMAFEGLANTFPAESSLEMTRYTRIGPVGSIVKKGSSVADCKTLKPIHDLYSAVTGETAYVANQEQIDNLVKRLGFEDKGIIGQTVSELNECNATKVVITCYGVNGFEIRVTNTTNSDTILKQLFPRYRYVRTNFIAWDSKGSSREVPPQPNVNPYKFNPPLVYNSNGSLVPLPGFT